MRLLKIIGWIMVVGIAFWVRWRYIWDIDLFIDEYPSLWNAEQTWRFGFPFMASGVLETRGILHSYLLVPFMGWDADSAIMSRMASLLFGMLCIGMVWKVGRQGWNERVAWLAVAGFILLPEAIEASGRVRFYALLLPLSLLTVGLAYQLIRAVVRNAPYATEQKYGRLFALCFGLTLFAMDEVILFYPAILLAMVLWHGWRFLFRRAVLRANLTVAVFLLLRALLELGAQSGYTDLLGANKNYFDLELEIADKWSTYRGLLVGGFRVWLSAFAGIAVGAALVSLWQWRGRIRRLSGFHQATLFFALQFMVVFSILLTVADWQEARYLWMLQPIWSLLAAAGAVYVIERVLAKATYRGAAVVAAGVALVALFWVGGWATTRVQPEGYAHVFSYVRDQIAPGDIVLSPQPLICAMVLRRRCDFYARERGYEDYVVRMGNRWVDRWTAAPLLHTSNHLEALLSTTGRLWLVADGHSLGERYNDPFIRAFVLQTDSVYEEQGVRAVLMHGRQPPVPYRVRGAYDPPITMGVFDLHAWEHTTPTPGEPLEVLLSWRLNNFLPEQINTSVQLVAADTQRLTQADGPPAKGTITSYDATNATFPDPKTVEIPADLPDGRYRLETIAYRVATGEAVAPPFAFSWFRVGAPPPPPQVASGMNWQAGITLTGYDTLPDTMTPNTSLPLRLVWHSRTKPTRDYVGFVHLLAPDGTILAQSDRTPENGFYPTSAWAVDDPVAEPHLLTLPPDLPAGEYRLMVGWYYLETGERLLLEDGRDALELHRFTVP